LCAARCARAPRGVKSLAAESEWKRLTSKRWRGDTG